ncbi:MAG: hypothetical protein IPN07_16355 [Dehalococcoidia bacterium]|nr:hypothetical protein [Dehalococcoidia bacterium]
MTSPSTSETSRQTRASNRTAIEDVHPVVLVIRDPDASDQIELFGLPVHVRVFYLDLGSSFDVRYPRDGDRPEVSGWAEGHLREAAGLPPGHRAREIIESTVRAVAERFGLDANGGVP